MKATAKIDLKVKDGSFILSKGDQIEVLPPHKDNPTVSFVVLGIDDVMRTSTAALGWCWFIFPLNIF